jgi:RsiW-degrading membrane proteinase PrsW (M82 family)
MIGFFSLFLSFIAGGFIAQTITNVTGYKQGPVMLGIVFGGIVIGALAAFGFQEGELLSQLIRYGAAAGGQGGSSLGSRVAQDLAWAAIGVVATCAGAWSRMR